MNTLLAKISLLLLILFIVVLYNLKFFTITHDNIGLAFTLFCPSLLAIIIDQSNKYYLSLYIIIYNFFAIIYICVTNININFINQHNVMVVFSVSLLGLLLYFTIPITTNIIFLVIKKYRLQYINTKIKNILLKWHIDI
jgi:hypothetical protein